MRNEAPGPVPWGPPSELETAYGLRSPRVPNVYDAWRPAQVGTTTSPNDLSFWTSLFGPLFGGERLRKEDCVKKISGRRRVPV
jgi:hypothetical protein